MSEKTLAVLLCTGFVLAGCVGDAASSRVAAGADRPGSPGSSASIPQDVATFAGGCFWCMEPPFETLDGVIEVVSGYTGGEEIDPSYRQVASGRTGHAEAVRVTYDPSRIGYAELLETFWRQIDPTDAGGQFADRGPQYRTAIFYHDEKQRRLAEASKARLEREGPFDRPVVTEIVPAGPFYAAEEYHQDFYKKNSKRYKSYRRGSGREGFLERVWGAQPVPRPSAYLKPSDDELQRRLTPLQYRVTQKEGTEPPFRNEFWNHKKPGIYVDVVSGEPLFASTDKYDSGTGWPSFTRPLEPDNIVRREDRKLGYVRVEVRSKHADSHLGHVFNDGPAPAGLRYCINSAALRFIARDDLQREGYERYLALFPD